MPIPRWTIVLVATLLVLGIGGGLYYRQKNNVQPVVVTSATPTATIVPTILPTATPLPTAVSTPLPTAKPTPNLVDPVANFRARVTKKTFGLYVTPSNSPVQPERFTGYHTGADAEYGDVTADVPVFAVTDGTVVISEWASGYGGVLALQGKLDGQTVYFIYGHLRQSSMVLKGKTVHQGDQLAVLGTAYSHETDGERRHLHFGIYAASPVSIKGYVQSKSALAAWRDPLAYF